MILVLAVLGIRTASAQEPFFVIQSATYGAINQGTLDAPAQVPPYLVVAKIIDRTKTSPECKGQTQFCPIYNINPKRLELTDPGGGTKRLRVYYTCEWSNPALQPVRMEADGVDGGSLGINCKGVRPIPLTKARIAIQMTDYHDQEATHHCQFDGFAKNMCDRKVSCSFEVDAELCPGYPGTSSHAASLTYACVYPGSQQPGYAPPQVLNTDSQTMKLDCRNR